MAERECPESVGCVLLEHSLRGVARVPRGIRPYLEEADVLVLHGGWLLSNIVVGRMASRFRIPWVVTTHGVFAAESLLRRATVKKTWATFLERPHLRRAAAVHIFFDEEKAGLQQLGVETPTIVVPNGVAIPEGLSWDGGSGGYLLWLGRYDVEVKGLDLLLAALGRIVPGKRPFLRMHGPDWRGQRRQVQRLVDEFGLTDSVLVGDPVYGEEKWTLLREARACVYPSRWDACPVSVAEAVAAGVPTLVARYPLGSFLAAAGAAVQVDATVKGIEEGLRSLLVSDNQGLSATAARTASERLSWEAVARSWLDQLMRVLPEHSSTRQGR